MLRQLGGIVIVVLGTACGLASSVEKGRVENPLGLVRWAELVGAPVVDARRVRVGEVADLVIHTPSGACAFVGVVAVEESESRSVPYPALRWDGVSRRFESRTLTAGELRALPVVDPQSLDALEDRLAAPRPSSAPAGPPDLWSDHVLASRMMEAEVCVRTAPVGRVDDLLVQVEAGVVGHLEWSTEEILGWGGVRYLLPWEAGSIDRLPQGHRRVRLPIEDHQIEHSPSRPREDAAIDADLLRRVRSFYRREDPAYQERALWGQPRYESSKD